jgi:hypothetical protein
MEEYSRSRRRIQRLSELTAPTMPSLKVSTVICNAQPSTPPSKQKVAFARAWANIHYHKMILSSLRNPTVDYSASILQWQQKHPTIIVSQPTTIEEASLGYSIALNELNEARQHASRLRDAFLQAQVDLYTHLEAHDKAHIVRRLKRAEETHRSRPQEEWEYWYIRTKGTSRPQYRPQSMPTGTRILEEHHSARRNCTLDHRAQSKAFRTSRRYSVYTTNDRNRTSL